MGIFNFGNKQRLHTQMYGETSGREMFKVDEYNSVKKLSLTLGMTMFCIFSLLFFVNSLIKTKLGLFLILVFIGCGVWEYFNIKHQINVRRSLY